MLMIGKCVLCGSGLKLIFRNIFDTRFGIKRKYKIGRCGACGIEQISPIPSPKDLKDLYETHYNFGGEKGTIYTRFRVRFFSSVFFTASGLPLAATSPSTGSKDLSGCWMWVVMRDVDFPFIKGMGLMWEDWN